MRHVLRVNLTRSSIILYNNGAMWEKSFASCTTVRTLGKLGNPVNFFFKVFITGISTTTKLGFL